MPIEEATKIIEELPTESRTILLMLLTEMKNDPHHSIILIEKIKALLQNRAPSEPLQASVTSAEK